MKRIGIAASRMAKENPTFYNAYVVLIAFLFSVFIFVVAGSTVLFSLIIISYIGNEITRFDLQSSWQSIFLVCMISLTVVMSIFMLLAISVNLKINYKKNKKTS